MGKEVTPRQAFTKAIDDVIAMYFKDFTCAPTRGEIQGIAEIAFDEHKFKWRENQ